MNGCHNGCLIFGALCLLFSVVLLSPASGAEERFSESHLASQSASKSIWKNGIGHGFRRGQLHAGFTVGAGFGTEVMGSTQEHDLAMATVNFGWVFTDVLSEDLWYRGNWEFQGELVGGTQFNPDSATVFGLSGIIRYNFAIGSSWVPFADGGLGVSYTDIGEPDLATKFEFITQFGAGARYFFSINKALVLQYRWFHLSNADIEDPNNGTNTQMFMIGLHWFL